MFAKRLVVLCALLLSTSLFAATPATDPGSYDRLLLPVFAPPARGANGSEFASRLLVWSRSRTETLQLYGVERPCIITCPPPRPDVPLEIAPWNPDDEFAAGVPIMPAGTPGRFIYVPRAQSANVAMNLRVYDLSRAAQNFGTELPVVRERDFVNGRIVLPGVPSGSAQFRNTLRIYAAEPVTVRVSFEGAVPFAELPPVLPLPHIVTLRPGADLFDPAYAVFTDFPNFAGYTNASWDHPLTVVVEPVAPSTASIWAFVSVTNNETQHITTITPQP